jgi:hypothetical protein
MRNVLSAARASGSVPVPPAPPGSKTWAALSTTSPSAPHGPRLRAPPCGKSSGRQVPRLRAAKSIRTGRRRHKRNFPDWESSEADLGRTSRLFGDEARSLGAAVRREPQAPNRRAPSSPSENSPPRGGSLAVCRNWVCRWRGSGESIGYRWNTECG